jgi:hypothetical protein
MRPTELVVGNCYFHVVYSDSDLMIPEIHTLVYVGTGEDLADGRRAWIFDAPGCLASSDPSAPAGPEDDVSAGMAFSDEQLYGVVDLAGLLRILNELRVDHPLSPLPPHPGPACAADVAELRDQVSRYVEGSERGWVTITIAFTDDGVSLSRREDGELYLSLHPEPRREPDEEPRLRAVCEAAGMSASEDYLFNGGRSRALTYPASALSFPSLLELLTRILLEVYGMRRGDQLLFKHHSTLTTKPT